jgi:hypothetical protein
VTQAPTARPRARPPGAAASRIARGHPLPLGASAKPARSIGERLSRARILLSEKERKLSAHASAREAMVGPKRRSNRLDLLRKPLWHRDILDGCHRRWHSHAGETQYHAGARAPRRAGAKRWPRMGREPEAGGADHLLAPTGGRGGFSAAADIRRARPPSRRDFQHACIDSDRMAVHALASNWRRPCEISFASQSLSS